MESSRPCSWDGHRTFNPRQRRTMTTLTQWVAEYGYWAVLAGALLEGESILFLAGFAAQQRTLSLPAVVAVGFAGAVIGDQVFFGIGRRFGAALIARWPQLQLRAQRVNWLLRRHHAWVIVGVRFAYGLRIAGPIVIGASSVPIQRFLLFNALGAAIWSPLVSGAGFLFGGAASWLLDSMSALEAAGLLLALIAGAAFTWLKLRR